MKLITGWLHHLDRFQQRHAVLAFPVAVIKRYGDDKAGRQAALITYYAFLSLFPLLLVFLSVLAIVASGSPSLQARISEHVFQYFPALGNDLQGSVHTLKGSGLPLALEMLALFYGARGFAMMLQDAFNNVWHVQNDHRPNAIGDYVRSFAMMLAVGVGIIIGTVFSYILSAVLHLGVTGTLLAIIVNLLVTIGLFLAVFRLGTASSIGWNYIIPGAIIAATGFLVVQHFGGRIMGHELPRLRGSYGSFYLALGMMFWIYLQAQVLLYALEISAVRAQHAWPKQLF